MKTLRLLVAALCIALPTVSHGQNPGLFPSGTVYGNSGASTGQPAPKSMTDMFDRAFCSTGNAALARVSGAWACLASANNSVWVTNGSGVPSLSATLPNAVQDNITRVGTVTSGSIAASLLTGTIPNAVQDNITRLGTIASMGAPLGATFGGFGANISASSGVPLFATGTPTFTSTSGTGNFARVGSPAFTGTPTAPTAAVGTNTTQVATTAFVGASQRVKLTADTTYNIPTDPNCSTIPLCQLYLATSVDGGGYNVTFQVADGTYDNAGHFVRPMVGVRSLTIQGNASNKNAVELKSTSSTFLYEFQDPTNALVKFRNLKVNCTGSTLGAFGVYQLNNLVLQNISWTDSGTSDICIQATVANVILIETQNIANTGTGGIFVGCGDNAFVSFEPDSHPTFSGTPAYAAFLQIYRGCTVSMQGITVTGGGSVTGPSYVITSGGNLDYNALSGTFPGNSTSDDGSGTVKNAAGTIIRSAAGTWLATQTFQCATDACNPVTIEGTAAGAVGPVIRLDHSSASPAANDILSILSFRGNNSTPGKVSYGQVYSSIITTTAGAEDGEMVLASTIAGVTGSRALAAGNGVQIGASPTGGYKGAGTINVQTGIYANNVAGMSGTISVRKGDDSGACNLVVTMGLITSTTC